MAETDIKKMKVTDLREALEKRGLSTEGLKADLVNRLQARLDEEEFGLVEAPPAGSPGNEEAPTAGSAVTADEKPAEKPLESSEPAKEETETAPAEEAPPASTAVEEPKKDDNGTAEDAKAEESKTESADAPKEAVPKVTAEMSFKERMEQRAKRFGIQPSEKTKKEMRSQRFGTGNRGGNPKNPQQQQGGGKKGKRGGQNNSPKKEQQQQQQQTGNKRRESGGGEGGKKKDTKKQKVGEKPLLPKEEIEKRLARAAKYGTTEGVDELKAMLRKHRFST